MSFQGLLTQSFCHQIIFHCMEVPLFFSPSVEGRGILLKASGVFSGPEAILFGASFSVTGLYRGPLLPPGDFFRHRHEF